MELTSFLLSNMTKIYIYVIFVKLANSPQVIQLQPQQMTSQSAPPGGIQVN